MTANMVRYHRLDFCLGASSFTHILAFTLSVEKSTESKRKIICKYDYKKSVDLLNHAEAAWDIQGFVNKTLSTTKIEVNLET